MTTEVTDAEFENKVVKEKLPVLVDFWAPWCGPCKALAPVLEELSKEMNGKVQIVKVNVDENPTSSAKHNIMSIPTLILFKGGKVVDQQIGAPSKAKLSEWILSKI